MKKFIFSFLLCFALFEVHGQVNLVPNPSFEERTGCPEGYPDLDGKLNDWMSFRGSPDYMNDCNPQVGSNNQFGYQEPHSGDAYVGFCTYKQTSSNIANEHIGVQLVTPLTIGEKYFVSFYTSSGYTPLLINIATNKLGALFTTYSYLQDDTFSPDYPMPNNQAHIYTNDIITDTINWTKISGSFVADSSYKYLVIGNFFEDQFLDTLHMPYSVVPQAAYYYLDDVCISTDSLYAQNWTTLSINEIQKNNLSVYPNPTSDFFVIQTDQGIDQIEICNSIGEIVMDKKYSLNEAKIDVSILKTGIYILKIKTKTGKNQTQKIVIQNLN